MLSEVQVIDGIKKTGYVLEYQIGVILRNHGWNIIAGKRYLDSEIEKVREIDIIAYKGFEVQGIKIFTTIVISCKKSEENDWILLAKPSNGRDPNIDWNPFHAWTNEKSLEFMLKQTEWRDSYIAQLKHNGCNAIVKIPDNHVFGFQELNKSSGKPQNDKPIYESITSLMKAQEYEMNVLSERKTEAAIYQFNLVSIADTDLIRLDFSETAAGTRMRSSQIDQEMYLATYLFKRKQIYSRIHFIKFDRFDNILDVYDCLHDVNVNFWETQKDNFYIKAIEDLRKISIYENDFVRDIIGGINTCLRVNYKIGIKKDHIMLFWDTELKKACVYISADIKKEHVEILNMDVNVLAGIRNALKKYYRYADDFYLSLTVPMVF